MSYVKEDTTIEWTTLKKLCKNDVYSVICVFACRVQEQQDFAISTSKEERFIKLNYFTSENTDYPVKKIVSVSITKHFASGSKDVGK